MSADAIPATPRNPAQRHRIRVTPCPDGWLAEVRFPMGKGGDATIAPTEAEAWARLREIVRAHEEGRNG